MGGRGSSSGRSGGGMSGSSLTSQLASDYNSVDHTQGTYDNGGNPTLIALQNMTATQKGHFFHDAENLDLNNNRQFDDGYSYHDIPLNRILAHANVKGGPQRLSASEFDDYCRQTGQSPMYRGWSGASSIDRFKNAPNNHVGNGIYGDGYYYAVSRNTAVSYAHGVSGNVTRVALSPNARVIDYQDLVSRMQSEPRRLQTSLRRTGRGGSGRTFGSNNGEAAYALSLGYNAVRVSHDYNYAITADALVISD